MDKHIIYRQTQVVYVSNGDTEYATGWQKKQFYQIESEQISTGLTASTATMSCHKKPLTLDETGTLVKWSADGKTVGMGIISSSDWSIDPTDKTYTCTVQDVVSYFLERIYVGQYGFTDCSVDVDGTVVYTKMSEISSPVYTRRVFRKGKGWIYCWTPSAIVHDIYDNLPENIKRIIKLGRIDIDDIGVNYFADKMDATLDFSTTSVAAALETLVSIFGTCAIVRRWEEDVCYLDIIDVTKNSYGIKQISVNNFCSQGSSPYDSSSLESFSCVTDKGDTKDRIIIKSSEGKKHQFNFWSPFVQTENKEIINNFLIPAWDRAAIVTTRRNYFDKLTNLVYSWDEELDVESYVLYYGKDCQDKKSEYYVAGIEHVFRRWQFPEWMRANPQIVIDDNIYVPNVLSEEPNLNDIPDPDDVVFKKQKSAALVEIPLARDVSQADVVINWQHTLGHKNFGFVQGWGYPEKYLWSGDKIPADAELEYGWVYSYGIKYMFFADTPQLPNSKIYWKLDEDKLVKEYSVIYDERLSDILTFGKLLRPTNYTIDGDFLVLEEAPIVPFYQSYRGGKGALRDISRFANFTIPVCLENTQLPCHYDTGLVADTVDGVEVLSTSVGQTHIIKGDYQQIVIDGLFIYNDEFNSITDDTYENTSSTDGNASNFTQDTSKIYKNYTPENPYTIKNDMTKMQALADAQLKLSKVAKRDIQLTLPYITWSIATGSVITVSGDGVPSVYHHKKFIVNNLSIDWVKGSMSISASTQIESLQNYYL